MIFFASCVYNVCSVCCANYHGSYWNVIHEKRALMPTVLATAPKQDAILLCYACLAWLASVCYALAALSLWRLAASANNVSPCRVRQHKDVCRASDKEGATEGGNHKKNITENFAAGGKDWRKRLLNLTYYEESAIGERCKIR